MTSTELFVIVCIIKLKLKVFKFDSIKMNSQESPALKRPKLSSDEEDDFDATGKIKILLFRFLSSDFLKLMFVVKNVNFDSASFVVFGIYCKRI